ncbi:type VI secretion system tip protein VgrG [Spirosoma flavum]|uniref:Type VI secretion system tip protein VgrG n=1 Tax=Spirosoma flavum TaxID=2048557 RepID=A0ABW6AHI0_9BACT
MVTSPLNAKLDLVSYRVLIDGKELDGTREVAQINVFFGVNRVSTARVEFLDGDPSEQLFAFSQDSTVKPGATISIQAGYHSENKEIFSGLIIGQTIFLASDSSSQLAVECRGNEVKMTIGRQSKTYENKKDSDVFTQLFSNHSLTADVTATTVSHKELVQYYCTDWDFLLSRAEANGLMVVPGKKVAVSKPSTSTKPVLRLTHGESVYTFNLELDARSQYSAVSGSFWDDLTQSVQALSATNPSVKTNGTDSSASLASVIGLSAFTVQTQAPLPAEEARAWLNGLWLKSALSKIKGTIKFPGNASVLLGNMVELVGFGNRFNGTAFVSQVNHTLEAGDWSTEIVLGLDEKWFIERQPDVMAPAAAGVLPGINGLCSGTVTKTDQDPEGHFRVQVRVPALNNELLWVRLAQQQASAGTGSFFYPETNDEVIIGFVGGDPRYGVILGSLYSKKQKPAYVPDAANTKKAWLTKENLKVEFDDEKKIITIETPGKNQIVFSDDAKSVTIKDQHGNAIIMNQDGITFDSKSAIKLKAASNIELEATGKIDIKATGDLALNGLNIAGKAQSQLKLEGTASAEVSAAGQMVIKGALVMIN